MRRHIQVAYGFAVWLLGAMSVDVALGQAGYVERIRVAAETRLDWVFSLTGKSVAAPPDALLGAYLSAAPSSGP